MAPVLLMNGIIPKVSDWLIFLIDNDETIDNVYDRKEKISSGEKARILDSDHRDGNVVYIVR